MPEHVDDHAAQCPERLLLATWRVELRQICEASVLLPTPDLTRPEEASLVRVLAEVTNDVRLLEHEAHAVREFQLLAEPGWLLPRGSEKFGEPLSNDTRNIVTIEVVVFDLLKINYACGCSLVSKVGHTQLHLASVLNDNIAQAAG
jgi:hypothetical protein